MLQLIKKFLSLKLAGYLLVFSGFVHQLIFLISPELWEGPLSIRKPILFGFSAGLTAWSLGWILQKLKLNKLSSLCCDILTVAFVLEVALITLQYWRKVPSHFNRATIFDSYVELTILCLILYVTVMIFWITRSVFYLSLPDPGEILAIRAGMVFLSISCLLGILISFIGHNLISLGLKPEIFPQNGVLKYPHGITIHAIQVLPLMNLLMKFINIENRVQNISFLIIGYLLFLFQALWQTFNGFTRFESNLIGNITGCFAIACFVLPVFLMSKKLIENFSK